MSKLEEIARKLLAKMAIDDAVLGLAAEARKDPGIMRDLARAYLETLSPKENVEKPKHAMASAKAIHSRGRIGRHQRRVPTPEQTSLEPNRDLVRPAPKWEKSDASESK